MRRPHRWLSRVAAGLMRRPNRAVSRVLTTALCLAASLEAHAGKFDETLDFSLQTRVATFDAGAIGLRTPARDPVVLTNPHLAGRARTITPLLRGNLSFHGLRVGVGAGFDGYTGLRLEHAPLPAGASVTEGRVWGIPIEGFAAYAFRPSKRVRPFVETRTTGTFIQAQARVASGVERERVPVRLRGTTLAVALRAGVLVHLNEYFFLDAGIGRVVYGTEGWTASVGIGIPIPLSNL